MRTTRQGHRRGVPPLYARGCLVGHRRAAHRRALLEVNGGTNAGSEHIARNWRDLIRPKMSSRSTSTATLTPTTYGKFTCEPLERGYGITLGNSLRRVLLSSLQGSAITTVRIEGALHEFTTVPGVVEDVTDIILNVKTPAQSAWTTRPRATLVIDKQGEGEVTAADIQCPTASAFCNPEQHVATISKGGRLRMEMTSAMGRGYFTADQNKAEGHADRGHPDRLAVLADPEGQLPGDQRPRRSSVTDYDRLAIEVWTDGSVRPEDAVAFAAKIPEGAALDLHQS